ncbi:MAG: hypothetical protein C0617_05090 [Desulfuromonas sp.]|nr:MAG: hypothetical protein C0617_05090 [Desulfuromonas sp.]
MTSFESQKRRNELFQIGLSCVVGALVVCLLATFQYIFVLRVDVSGRNFIIPVLVGGLAGFSLGFWFFKIKKYTRDLQKSESRYRDLFENASDLIQSVAPDGTILYANRAWRETLGYSEEETSKLSVMDIIHPDCLDHCMATFESLLSVEKTARMEANFQTKDGRTITVEGSVNFSFENGRPVSSRGIFRDITARRATEEALKRSYEFSKTVIDSMNDAVSIIDVSDYRLVGVNRVFLEELGMKAEEVIGKTCYEITHDRDTPCALPDHFCPLMDTAAKAQYASVEHIHRGAGGRTKYVEVSTSPIVDETGRVLQVVHVSRDITDRKRAENEIQQLAYYDTLTGLPNRTLLHDHLNLTLAQADRSKEVVAILFLDLDRFKDINDTLGHPFGDKLLKSVAGRLRDAVRKSDTVARLAGDEFVMVLSGVKDAEGLPGFAQNLLQELALPHKLEGREVYSTGSIGIAFYPMDGKNVDHLLKNADTAMYVAKERGRNTYQFFSEEMNIRAMERLKLETDLRGAMKRDELFLHYQPQMELSTGKVIGMEALVRWRHPERGFVSSGTFVPLAEEAGLIVPLGEWILRTACAQAKAWQEQGFPPLRLAVNISGLQFKQPNFVDLVEEVIMETGLDAGFLELELTESIIMENAAESIEVLTDLKVRGIHLSIDDFGTGYYSLSYLKNFPFDRIKIAQSFVRDITTSSDDAAIVEAIIVMGKSLDLKVIAEGVETREQLEFLFARDCNEMQGFYFSKPLAREDFTRLLQEGLAREGVCPFRVS